MTTSCDVTSGQGRFRSLPVALSVMRNDTFCTTTIVQNVGKMTSQKEKKTREKWRHFLWRYFRSAQLPVTSDQGHFR